MDGIIFKKNQQKMQENTEMNSKFIFEVGSQVKLLRFISDITDVEMFVLNLKKKTDIVTNVRIIKAATMPLVDWKTGARSTRFTPSPVSTL